MTMCIRERVDVRPWSAGLAADIDRVVRDLGRIAPSLRRRRRLPLRALFDRRLLLRSCRVPLPDVRREAARRGGRVSRSACSRIPTMQRVGSRRRLPRRRSSTPTSRAISIATRSRPPDADPCDGYRDRRAAGSHPRRRCGSPAVAHPRRRHEGLLRRGARRRSFDVRAVNGIVAYAPGELVLTARGGTPLAEVEDALAAHGQMLAFEPPHHGAGATLGGIVATGFSGPRRAHAGSARDFVLGVRVDRRHWHVARVRRPGDQERRGLRRVAADDRRARHARRASRKSRSSACRARRSKRRASSTATRVGCAARCQRMGRQAVAGVGDVLSSRKTVGSGSPARRPPSERGARSSAARKSTALRVLARIARPDARLFRIRRCDGDATLWRLSVRSTAPWVELAGGRDDRVGRRAALARVQRRRLPGRSLRAWAAEHGGHATLYRGRDKSAGAFQPLPPPMRALHERLKQVFDPHGILNRGRLYAAC